MIVELDKEDLRSLIRGTRVHPSLYKNKTLAHHGVSVATHTWNWYPSAFIGCTDEELYKIYKIVKAPWNSKKGCTRRWFHRFETTRSVS